MPEPELWHRIWDRSFSVADEYGDHYHSSYEVVLSSYEVLKHTPKGVWLEHMFGKRFVFKAARKRWACPTKEEALESYLARKRKQAEIYQNRANLARECAVTAVKVLESKRDRLTVYSFSFHKEPTHAPR